MRTNKPASRRRIFVRANQIADDLARRGKVVRRKPQDFCEPVADAACGVCSVAEFRARYSADPALSVQNIPMARSQEHPTCSGTVASPLTAWNTFGLREIPGLWSESNAFRLQPPRALILVGLLVSTLVMFSRLQGQTLVSSTIAGQATPNDGTSLSLLVGQARRHPSYQVFAGHIVLPSIAVVDKTTLEIDGKVKIDVSRLDQLAQPQKESLGSQFDVPIGVVDKLLVSRTDQAPMDAAQVAAKLCETVMDYKYLLEKWTRYRPPNGKEKVKADALLALAAGQLDKAWTMFLELPRPQPPTSVRVEGRN